MDSSGAWFGKFFQMPTFVSIFNTALCKMLVFVSIFFAVLVFSSSSANLAPKLPHKIIRFSRFAFHVPAHKRDRAPFFSASRRTRQAVRNASPFSPLRCPGRPLLRVRYAFNRPRGFCALCGRYFGTSRIVYHKTAPQPCEHYQL